MWSVHVADGVNVLRMFEKRRDDKMGAGVGECTHTVNAHTGTKGRNWRVIITAW